MQEPRAFCDACCAMYAAAALCLLFVVLMSPRDMHGCPGDLLLRCYKIRAAAPGCTTGLRFLCAPGQLPGACFSATALHTVATAAGGSCYPVSSGCVARGACGPLGLYKWVAVL